MVLPLAVAMVLFVARVTLQQRADLLQQSEDRARVLARALAVSTYSEVLESDIQGMQDLLQPMSSYPDLRYAMVLNPEGRVLAHTDPAFVGQYLADSPSRAFLAGPARISTLVRTDRLVDVGTPILVQGKLVGWVRIGLGQEATAASLRSLMRDGAVFTALALALGALASFLVSRRLSGGLDRLVALARETDPNGPSTPSRRDELSELGRAFDRLTQELDHRVRDLQNRERFLQDLMENLTVAVLAHRAEGTLEYANPAALALLGRSLDQIRGRTLPEVVGDFFLEDGETIPPEAFPVAQVMAGRQPIRGRVIGFRREAGGPPWWTLMDVFQEPSGGGGLGRIIVAMFDITERQEARNHLRQTLTELEDLYQNAPCGYHSLGPDGTILRINSTELSWLGYSREEVVGKKTFADLMTPASRHLFMEQFPGFRERGWVQDLEFDLVRKDGTPLSVLLNATAIKGPDGAYLYSRSTVTDVTRRLKAERALRASQTSLADAQRIAHLGNWELDLSRNVLTWSEEIYHIFEMDPAAFGASYEAFLAAIHPEDRERVDQAYRESLATRRPYDIVHRLLMPDGRIKHVHERCETRFDAEGRFLRSVGTVQDITEQEQAEQERRRLEVEVNHFQRLDSLGNLAGGVAHDMNNILAVILSLSELQLERLPASDPAAHAFELARNACTRGADLVRRLTQFARKQMEKAEMLDLNALVREQRDILERTTLRKAEWALDLEEPLHPVLGQASEISNAIINLSVNALDAMPRGGRIILRTRSLPGGGVDLSVEDNGTGMPPEILARALDPFFTTKPVGKGTGLGLATVYGTMKSHGGTVEIQSQPGAGTTVHLRFPPARPLGKEPAMPPPATGALPPLRVLLVDDDDWIRLTVPPLLQHLGLTAETAPGGLKALERLQAGPEVDLVILDQNMPQMSGLETLARIRETRPDLPVILSSGYREPDQASLPAPCAELAILEKPYTLEALRDTLARLVAARPRP
jgi:PAS domain S-box-containing protein